MQGSRITRRKGSPYYQCAYYDAAGVLIRESTKCTDRKAAELFLKRREREVHDTAHSSRHEGKNLDVALKDFVHSLAGSSRSANTIRMYAHRGSQLSRVLGDRDLHTLTKADVIGYIKRRGEEGASSHTIYKELVTLRQTFKHHEVEHASRLPAFKSGYVPTKRWLSRADYRALQLRLEPARRLWVDGAVLLGGRKDELERVAWEDVNWETLEVHIRGTKTPGSDRLVPLPLALAKQLFAEALKAHPAIPSGPILGKWSKAVRDLKAACKRAGIAPVNPTALRHTFGSWLVQQGVSLSVIAKLMGNSVAMVEKVYGHLDRETFRRASQRLGEYHEEAQIRPPEVPAESAAEEKKDEEKPEPSRWGLLEVD